MINAIISSFKNHHHESKRQRLQSSIDEGLSSRTETIRELKESLIQSYLEDHTEDIEFYSARLERTQGMVRYYQGLNSAINNPLLNTVLRAVRFQKKKEQELLAQQPIDFDIERAKRAHEQRIIERDEWFDSLPHDEIMRRLDAELVYAGCPIGNFAAIEAGYKDGTLGITYNPDIHD